MRAPKTLLVVMIMGLVLVACGEGRSDPTEAGLSQRAEAAAEASSSANQKDHPWDIWRDVYGYLTPEYRKRCGPDEEFGLRVHDNLQRLVGEAVLRGAVELEGALVGRNSGVRYRFNFAENVFDGDVLTRYATELDYRVTGVTVDRNKGQVELAVSHLGAPVTIAGDPRMEDWVYAGGQWFLESSGYWMDSMERDGEGCFYASITMFN